MKIINIVLTLFITILLIPFYGCSTGFAYEQKLAGKYGLIAVDTLSDMSINELSPKGNGVEVIGPIVYAVGWNDDFIIAKQGPSHTKTPFFILRVKDGKKWGPLTEQAFQEERIKQKVSTDLTFTLVFDELK